MTVRFVRVGVRDILNQLLHVTAALNFETVYNKAHLVEILIFVQPFGLLLIPRLRVPRALHCAMVHTVTWFKPSLAFLHHPQLDRGQRVNHGHGSTLPITYGVVAK